MHERAGNATVYLVDDDASIRAAMTRALTVEGFNVRTWATAEAFIAEYDPREFGCLVSDVSMPGIDGLQLQERLSRIDRSLPIVFISGNGHVRMSVQAMRAGAVTFLEKPARITELVEAIDEGLARAERLRQQIAANASLEERLASLTRRERQVLQLVITGKMNKQIAAQLGAAEKTIKVHRGRVMDKMHVRSVAELVAMIARRETLEEPMPL